MTNELDELKEPIKKSTNSNTEHSKKLRIKTSALWRKKNLFNIKILLRKDKPEHTAFFEKFKNLPQKNRLKKIDFLLTFYEKNK